MFMIILILKLSAIMKTTPLKYSLLNSFHINKEGNVSQTFYIGPGFDTSSCPKKSKQVVTISIVDMKG